MYNILPETENRSLEDIEIHFSDKTKKLTDYKIAKLDLSQLNNNEMKTNSNGIQANGQHPSLIMHSDEPTKDTSNIKHIGCDNRGFVKDN